MIKIYVSLYFTVMKKRGYFNFIREKAFAKRQKKAPRTNCKGAFFVLIVLTQHFFDVFVRHFLQMVNLPIDFSGSH